MLLTPYSTSKLFFKERLTPPLGYLLEQVDVYYRGDPVQGSPFTVNVTDENQGVQVVNFNQDDRFLENREADIPIMIPEGASSTYLTCRVTDPENQILHHELVYDPQSNLYHIRFVPIRPGRHRVDVEYNGVPVDGSPFILNIEGNEGHKKVFASGAGLKGGGIKNEKYCFYPRALFLILTDNAFGLVISPRTAPL